MRRIGPKTAAWMEAREHLKHRFEEMQVTTCELHWPHHCWRNNGLSFAHSKKRRFIEGDEIYEVALLCPIAHDMVERLSHREMYNVIREIIKNREEKLNEYCACEDD